MSKFSTRSLALCLLIVLAHDLQAATPQKGKYADRMLGMRYITFSAGTGLWCRSMQPRAEYYSFPVSVFAEFGRTSLPLSFVAGTSFKTIFFIDQFLLNPNDFTLGVQYAPLRGRKIARKINIYGQAGINLCYSRFTESVYPGITSYEYKVEKDLSPGIAAGLLLGYKWRDFEVRPGMFFFSGKSDFYAGHFTRQEFSTSSFQFHVQLNYRFIFRGRSGACPAYRKFINL